MKNIRVMAFGLSALMLVSMAGAALAGPRLHRINERRENQQERIQQGVRSGELTRHEAHELREREHRIGHFEREARADGNLSSQEAHRLNRMENRESHAIYNQKHDGQERR